MVAVWARLIGIGLVAGIFSALFGVGGGIIVVPLLIILLHVQTHEATAISLGAIVITALAGVIAYSLRGEVDVAYAALLGAPAAVGALVGTTLQQRLRQRALTLAFAGLLAGVAVWLIVG